MITGERLVLDDKHRGFEYARHSFAYQFAAGLAKGAAALDMGCGEGYGTALLAREAASADGVDRSEEAVRNSAAAHSVPNLRFIRADATATGLPAASYDVVCAFQVIEHFSDPAPLLLEMSRLLKPGGRAVISTINRDVAGSVFNPYHPVEYDRAELEELLKRHFSGVKMYGVIANEKTMAELRAFKARAALLMKLDIFGLRRLAHLAPFRRLYDLAVIFARLTTSGKAAPAGGEDYAFTASETEPGKGIDFLAVCTK